MPPVPNPSATAHNYFPGKFLEVLAKRKTSQALVFLLKAQPHGALLVDPGDDLLPSPLPKARLPREGDGDGGNESDDGWVWKREKGWRERSIEASLVQPGDVLRVLPGAQASFKFYFVFGITYQAAAIFSVSSAPRFFSLCFGEKKKKKKLITVFDGRDAPLGKHIYRIISKVFFFLIQVWKKYKMLNSKVVDFEVLKYEKGR